MNRNSIGTMNVISYSYSVSPQQLIFFGVKDDVYNWSSDSNNHGKIIGQ